MGKIKDTYGRCCEHCETRNEKNYAECVECFSKFITPIQKGCCPKCLDPRPEKYLIYDHCYTCNKNILNNIYYLDGVIACGYDYNDMDFGFALHGYKNSGINASWMAFPLQALTTLFLEEHISCIERKYGNIDYIIPIPGHAENLLTREEYNGVPIIKCLIDNRDPNQRQSSGGCIQTFNESRFTINSTMARIKGCNILLFDDMLTKGSTSNSAAYALKNAGVKKVILFTIGKHIDNTSEYLPDKIPNFTIDECIFCR